MAKKTRQVRLEEDVADMADRLASLQTPPETAPVLLSRLLRPMLRRELAKALEKGLKELREDKEADDE
jgi:hypothetical protein